MAQAGDHGVLVTPSAARMLCQILRVPTAVEVKRTLARLPNVILSDHPVRWLHGHRKRPVVEGAAWVGTRPLNGVSPVGVASGGEEGVACGCGDPFEEWCTRHGDFVVTFANWSKYQEDTTARERAKALRSKKRGEEKRGEENPPNPPKGKTVTRNPNHGQHCQCDRCEAAKREREADTT
jgi:hypothetical protein